MSIAMPISGCSGPCTALAISTSSPVWYWNRSTVCAAWCQSRWSVQLRGWPRAFRFVRRKKYVCTSICWIDSSPVAMRRWIHWCDGLNRRVCPTIHVRPVSPCTRSTSSASAQLSASGISTWTCLPARIAAMACCAWSGVGVHRMTASTSLRARRPSRCLTPKAPAPASAIRMCLVLFLAGLVGGPQHDVPDRGVGSRDMVEAVELLDVAAQSAAHDQPHDQLDALGARLAQILDVWHEREAVRVVDQPVEERGVELLIDEARTRPLQLVAHAAGAPDVDREVVVEALDGPTDRLAQVVAAVTGRGWVLHDVHGERDDLHGPLVRLAIDKGERDGEAVVDVELVHQGEVELVEDERLR